MKSGTIARGADARPEGFDASRVALMARSYALIRALESGGCWGCSWQRPSAWSGMMKTLPKPANCDVDWVLRRCRRAGCSCPLPSPVRSPGARSFRPRSVQPAASECRRSDCATQTVQFVSGNRSGTAQLVAPVVSSGSAGDAGNWYMPSYGAGCNWTQFCMPS